MISSYMCDCSVCWKNLGETKMAYGTKLAADAAHKTINPPVVVTEFVQHTLGSTNPLYKIGDGTWLLRSTIQRMIEETGYLNIYPPTVDGDEVEPNYSDSAEQTAARGVKSTTLKDINAAGNSDIDVTLARRGNNYGDFSENASVAQYLKDGLHEADSWFAAPDYVREATDMILSKLARCFSGNTLYVDNWTDIQGYAKLVEDRLNKETK